MRVANVQDLELLRPREPNVVDVYNWVEELRYQKL